MGATWQGKIPYDEIPQEEVWSDLLWYFIEKFCGEHVELPCALMDANLIAAEISMAVGPGHRNSDADCVIFRVTLTSSDEKIILSALADVTVFTETEKALLAELLAQGKDPREAVRVVRRITTLNP
jgi:hypothetical protein